MTITLDPTSAAITVALFVLAITVTLQAILFVRFRRAMALELHYAKAANRDLQVRVANIEAAYRRAGGKNEANDIAKQRIEWERGVSPFLGQIDGGEKT